MEYLAVVEKADDGSYSAYVPDLPGCVSCGDSPGEVGESIREAIRLHLESLRRHREPIPTPSSFAIEPAPVGEAGASRCPTEVRDLMVQLIQTGLLRIRALGSSGRADRCAIEADHIHNLPDLLEDYSPARLASYWEVERASYLAQLADEERAAWEPLWSRLRPYAEGIGATAH